MKTLLMKALLCLALANCFYENQARAQGHETHGGEIVYVDGKMVLRDKADDTTVVCKTGPEVVAESTLWSAILDNSVELNRYVKRAYELEMNKMIFCFGKADLVKIVAEDKDASYYPYTANHQTVTVARRRGDIVYVNEALFNEIKKDPELFADLLIHETTHGLIPERVDNRNGKVRSFTSILLKPRADSSRPVTPAERDSFALQMKVNMVQISRNYQAFDKYKSDLATAFDVSANSVDRVVGARKATLILNELRPEDQYLIHTLLNDVELKTYSSELFAFAIAWNDRFLLEKLLSLGANPNERVGNFAAIDYAIIFDMGNIFNLLVEDSRTRLSGSLDLAYQFKRKAFFYVLTRDSRATLSDETLKKITADQDRDYFNAIQNQAPLMNAVGFSHFLDVVLPNLAGSFESAAREKAFNDKFVSNGKYDVKALYSYALYRNFQETARRLFEQYPDQLGFTRNEQGDDAMETAIRNHDLALVGQILKDVRFDAKAMNPNTGNTYLQTAVIYNQVEIVKIFKADARFDLNQRSAGGSTAMDYAKRFNRTEIIQILK
jgi:hypothetical protein